MARSVLQYFFRLYFYFLCLVELLSFLRDCFMQANKPVQNKFPVFVPCLFLTISIIKIYIMIILYIYKNTRIEHN